MKLIRLFPVSAFLAGALAVAGEPNALQQRNLPGKPAQPRFELKDRDWPTQYGGASVCLWKDDAFAAFTLGIDDNCAANVPWWLDMSQKYGLRPTWFITTSGVDVPGGRLGMAGTWDLWRGLHAKGFGVQSHSVTHGANWNGADREYADSQTAIATNVPGNKCLTIAYPGGAGCSNNAAIAMKYYIAGRGGRPFQNPANKIDYSEVGGTSAGIVLDDTAAWVGTLKKLFDPSPKNSLWRGWYVGFYHYIQPKAPASYYEELEQKFAYVQEKIRSNDLWMGLFDEVAQYGQERDTARLTVPEILPGKITLNVTDAMDDKLFDFPLTIKVRLNPDWKAAQATQGGQSVGCTLAEHDGAKYALVQAVPDRGPLFLTPD